MIIFLCRIFRAGVMPDNAFWQSDNMPDAPRRIQQKNNRNMCRMNKKHLE